MIKLAPNKQLLPNVPFQSTKIRKKELSVDNKIQETNGDCFVRHLLMKLAFTFQPIKRLVSTTLKSAQPAATF